MTCSIDSRPLATAEARLSVDGEAAYVYDGEGNRVRKLLGANLVMVYSISGELLAEFTAPGPANAILEKEYIYGVNGLAATIATSEGTRYVTADHLGSPRIITGTTGAVVSRHDYEPFGEELFAGMGGRTTLQGYSNAADSLRQRFTGKERDDETGLDYFGARYYASTQGRFTGVDPLDPVLGKQGAGDTEEAEKQFQAYLAEPQRWNRYTYSLNNPLRYVDPDGFDPLVVNVNIIFDKGRYTEAQKKTFADSYVAQAQRDFGNIDIQFHVHYQEGTATNTGSHNTHEITSGVASEPGQSYINVFVTPDRVGDSPEVTNYNKGEIWISTGGSNNTKNPGNLTHGLIHALGLSAGINGYDPVDTKTGDRWTHLWRAAKNALFGNSAESSTQSLQDHLRSMSEGGCKCPVRTAYVKEINILREGAQKYLRK